MDDAGPRFDGVFHYDATLRLEACMCGVLLLPPLSGLSGRNTTRDNSTVLQSRMFSESPNGWHHWL
jgi:hypothetical protein